MILNPGGYQGLGMPDFPVSESKHHSLAAAMARLGIREEDLEERFIRSQGPGGQHVNKTSTCVVLRHLPTGLMVRCQAERSQSLNRFLARRLLVEKLEARLHQAKSQREQAQEKIRRQKRRRSRRAQAKMLDDKHHRAQKKELRQRPSAEE